jgi:NADH-quinone oxidoreductase subunit C
MEAAAQDKLVAIVKERFEGQLTNVETVRDILTLTFTKDSIVEVIEYLYNHPETKFQFLTNLFGVHYPEKNEIELVYQLHNLVSNQRLRIKTQLPIQNPTIKTITTIFSGANWMERETYDFFGVNFEGHPDLRRVLNVEDMIIFPMRKEYPLEDQTREDKDNTLFGR